MLGSNAAMNSQGYINPAAYPGGLQSASTSSQSGSIMAIGTNSTSSSQNYWNTSQAKSAFPTHQDKMYTVMQYADAIGWDLTHHYLPVGMASDDPKIAMLKLVNVGEILKDVGVRTSDTDYYIMREPSA
jgi:hypothetical protein